MNLTILIKTLEPLLEDFSKNPSPEALTPIQIILNSYLLDNHSHDVVLCVGKIANLLSLYLSGDKFDFSLFRELLHDNLSSLKFNALFLYDQLSDFHSSLGSMINLDDFIDDI